METPRRSSINKISGGSVEQKKSLQNHYLETFTLTSKPGNEPERPPTSQEREIVEAVVVKMSAFLQRYGAEPLAVTPEHIHFLDESKLNEEQLQIIMRKFPKAKAFYSPQTQEVWMLPSAMKSPLTFAKSLAHELIHFLGFNSAFITGDRKMQMHRMGLAAQHPKKEVGEMPGLDYFNETNEATTEGLVKRFLPELKDVPALKEEYEKLARVQQEHNDDIAYVSVREVQTESGTNYEATVEKFSYSEFRKADQELFREIVKQHPNEFSSEEEVFDIFARAAMTGDVRRMATLVESLGRGAFRALARRETPRGDSAE